MPENEQPVDKSAEGNPTGRPPHKPTAALRKKVELGAAGGVSHEDLALVLGISRHTLEKHYEHQLSIGAADRRMKWLGYLEKAASKGNVSAAKFLMGTVATLGVPPAPNPAGGQKAAGAPAPTSAPVAVGKKEAQQQTAERAVSDGTGDWGPLLRGPNTPLQ